MMDGEISGLLEAVERDSIAGMLSILEKGDIDLNVAVSLDEIFGLEEPDETPLLFFVIMRGISIEAMSVLVEHGLNLDHVNSEGLGAVDIAIKYGRADILAFCRKSGMDVCKSRRKSGMTPLMLAASFDDVEIMEYLLSEGSRVDAKDRYGMRALDYARKLQKKRAERFLTEYKAG